MDSITSENGIHSAKMRAIEWYLSQGWALVPIAPGAKLPAIAYPHPRDVRCRGRADGCALDGHGCHDATTDRATVERWWRERPAANVGIATGAPSGHWVLDYDPAAAAPMVGGRRTAVDIVHVLIHDERMPPHVTTGGGGWHWRFAVPDFDVTNRRGALPAGFDVRGTGGYVVAPPSVSGKGAYVELPTSTAGAPYVAPAWLLDMIRPTVRDGNQPQTGPSAGWSPSPSRPVPGDGAPEGDRGQRYAAAAVRDMLADLRVAESGRNALAFRYACRIIEMDNAGWLTGPRDSTWTAWREATFAHPAGVVVPASEVDAIWRSATRTVGARAAILDSPDPLALSAMAPPLPPPGSPPFSSNGGGAPLTLAAPTPPPDGVTAVEDPWEAAVRREMARLAVVREAKRRLAAADAVGPEGLRGELLDTAAMLARPRLVPVVDGLLYRGTVARINGAPGSGKTFVSLDMAGRVAAGMPWCDRATTAVLVVYVVAEGGGGVGRRIEAWQAYHGRPMEVLWLPRSVQIGGPEWDAWCSILAERSAGLVVLDTQARATVGRNEIDGQEMGEVLACLDALAARIDGCVLLVHHTPVGGTRARGHGSMTGGLQTELLVTKTGREIQVRPTKGKDDDDDRDPWVLDLIDVEAPMAGVAPVGVVPVWRGARPVDDGAHAGEPAFRAHARALWTAIEHEVNPGLGATEAEIRALAASLPVIAGLSQKSGAQRKAINKAWNTLIALGLLARGFRERRFKVVVLEDQSADGVLTSNRGSDGVPLHEAPAGFEVCGEVDAKAGM